MVVSVQTPSVMLLGSREHHGMAPKVCAQPRQPRTGTEPWKGAHGTVGTQPCRRYGSGCVAPNLPAAVVNSPWKNHRGFSSFPRTRSLLPSLQPHAPGEFAQAGAGKSPPSAGGHGPSSRAPGSGTKQRLAGTPRALPACHQLPSEAARWEEARTKAPSPQLPPCRSSGPSQDAQKEPPKVPPCPPQ